MSFVKGVRARLRSVLRRAETEARMEEEFGFHVAMETELHMRRGLSAAEARRRALLGFGGVDRHSERMRDGRGLRWLADMGRDVGFALRGLRRSRVFAAVAIVTVGVGVGATTSLFSVANAVLLQALPVHEPGEVVAVQEHRIGASSTGIEGWRIPYERFVRYREATRDLFTDLAAHQLKSVSLRASGDAAPAHAVFMAGDYFGVLGVVPRLGRFPRSDSEDVVVLSYRTWQRQYGGAADVIGRAVFVDGRPYEIAGVAPARFTGTTFGTVPDVWVPHRAHARQRLESFEQWVTPFGRLAPGVSRDVAQRAADAIGKRLEDTGGATVRRVEVEPLSRLAGEGRRIAAQFMTMLIAAGLLVLFIAAANIAGMLLARAAGRRHEIAIRLAIGAGRGRLVRQLLVESVVLFLLGGALGVVLAFGGSRLLASVRAPAPAAGLELTATPDLRVLLFALVITIVPALLFGLAPALQATRPELVPALKDGSPGGGMRSLGMRSAFVVGQLAVAVVLLISAGLIVRSLRAGLNVDPGFETAGILVASVNVTPHGYHEERGRAFFGDLVERVRAQPGVASVGLAERVLVTGESYGSDVRAADDPGAERRTNAGFNVVDTAYFGVLRMRLLAGRGFTPEDRAGAPRTAVINETLARRLWNETNVVGRSFLEGDTEARVVGVLKDGKYVEVGESPRPFVFYPFAQQYSGDMVLHIRATVPPGEVIASLRDAVRVLDPNVAVVYAESLSWMVGITLFPQRFAASLVGSLGLLGLLLAGIGVYGVLMYSVTQRIHEFGIRIALGASGYDVAAPVLARSLRLAGIGVAIGVLAAWFSARLLAGLMFGVSPRDPVTFVVVPAVLAAVALAAAWHPIRRALRADPILTLRAG